jgi:Tol biopolymer transport system component
LDAAISADGRYTVYVQDDGGEQSIWLKQVTTGSNVQVVAPTAVTYQGLAFSLDNNWIYYNVWDRKGVGEIFRVPVLGGASQKIVHDCMPGVAVSPKGNKIAFVRSDDKLERTLLLTIDTETREEKTIVSKNRGEAFLSGFAWSRAGDSIAYLGGRWSGTDLPNFFINEVSIAAGTEASLWTIPMNWNNFGGGFVWRSDKKDLFLTLAENQSPSNQIWYVSYETGEVRQLTKDFNNYASLGLTPDGENLITVQSDFFLSVWAVPTDRPAEAKRVTDGKTEGIGVAFTPDNRIVYGSTITGNVDLWISDIDGKNKRQLTSDAATEIQPCVAADGKTIVFVSSDNGLLWRIWSMDINGSNRRLIGPLPNQWSAVCSKKENAVLLSNNTDKVGQLQSYSLDTGKSTILLNKDVFRASISPDGKQLAYSFWDRNTQRLSREIFDIETNKTQQFELPVSSVGEYGQNESSAKWMPDGRALSFINREKGVSNVWIKTIGNDAEPRPITTFSENYILTYDWSSDGKWLSVVRGMTMSDVVIIKNEE